MLIRKNDSLGALTTIDLILPSHEYLFSSTSAHNSLRLSIALDIQIERLFCPLQAS